MAGETAAALDANLKGGEEERRQVRYALTSSAICRGGKPSIRCPSSCTTPASGASCPLIKLKHVVLPAPLGPISATSSPAGTANETS